MVLVGHYWVNLAAGEGISDVLQIRKQYVCLRSIGECNNAISKKNGRGRGI
jgi:hypothetical protein